MSLIQGAGFTGAATGVNLARDIEQGWFDRLLASPAPRPVLLAGLVALGQPAGADPRHLAAHRRASRSASAGRASAGLLLAICFVMGMGTVAACWGVSLALKFKSPVGGAADAGRDVHPRPVHDRLCADRAAAATGSRTSPRLNPVTQVIEAIRQGFITGTITWAETWPGLLALAGF